MMPCPAYRCSKTEPQAVRHHDNFHVFNILPVTTLRTIDLGGKKNSGPLFSRFCAEMRVFFEVNSAPEYVHQRRVARASANTLGSISSTLAKTAKDGAPSVRLGDKRNAGMTTDTAIPGRGRRSGSPAARCDVGYTNPGVRPQSFPWRRDPSSWRFRFARQWRRLT